MKSSHQFILAVFVYCAINYSVVDELSLILSFCFQ